MRHREDGVLVGARPPRARLAVTEAEVGHAPGDELAPDLAGAIRAVGGVDVRARVVDADLDQADVLDHRRLLVVAAGGKGDRLGAGRGNEERDRGKRRERHPPSHGSPPKSPRRILESHHLLLLEETADARASGIPRFTVAGPNRAPSPRIRRGVPRVPAAAERFTKKVLGYRVFFSQSSRRPAVAARRGFKVAGEIADGIRVAERLRIAAVSAVEPVARLELSANLHWMLL